MNNFQCLRAAVAVCAVLSVALSSCNSSTSTTTNPSSNGGCGDGILCATIGSTSYVAEVYNPVGDYIANKSAGSFARLQDPYYGFKFHIEVYGQDSIHPQQSIEIGVGGN